MTGLPATPRLNFSEGAGVGPHTMTPSEWAAVFRRLPDGYRKELSPQRPPTAYRQTHAHLAVAAPLQSGGRDIAEALSAIAGRHIKVATVDTQVERLFERWGGGVHREWNSPSGSAQNCAWCGGGRSRRDEPRMLLKDCVTVPVPFILRRRLMCDSCWTRSILICRPSE
jgi:hypothetical protein